jgi:uncharacterized glyoxalase superfamily protein PhnB
VSEVFPQLGALVLFTSRQQDCVDFYRLVGAPLVEEQHDDGDVHFACEVGGVHFAVFPVTDSGRAPEYGTSGCSFPGFAVKSVHAVVEAAARQEVTVLQPPAEYPWGVRAVLRDPDGRPVEVFEPR